jgi:hypothetical protein
MTQYVRLLPGERGVPGGQRRIPTTDAADLVSSGVAGGVGSLPLLAADPTPPSSGSYAYYNTTLALARVWTGSAWVNL